MSVKINSSRALHLGALLVAGSVALALHCLSSNDTGDQDTGDRVTTGTAAGSRVDQSWSPGEEQTSPDSVDVANSRVVAAEEQAAATAFSATLRAVSGPGGWDGSGGELRIVLSSDSEPGSGAFVVTTTSGSWTGELAAAEYSIVGVSGTETLYELLGAESLSPEHPVAAVHVAPRVGWFIDVVDGLTGLRIDKPFELISDPAGSSGVDAIVLPGALRMQFHGRSLVEGAMAKRRKYLVCAEGYASEVVWHSIEHGDVVVEVAPVADLTVEPGRACEIEIYRFQRDGELRRVYRESLESMRERHPKPVTLVGIPAGRYVLYATFKTSGVLRTELDVYAGRRNHAVISPDPTTLASLEISLDLPAAGQFTADDVFVRRLVRLGDHLDPEASRVEGGWRSASPQRRESLREWDEIAAGRRWSRSYDRLVPGEYRFEFEPLGISTEVVLQPGDHRAVSVSGDSLRLVQFRFTGWPDTHRPLSLVTVHDSSQHGSVSSVPGDEDRLLTWVSEEPALVVARGGDAIRWCRLERGVRDLAISYDDAGAPQTFDVSLWRGGLPVHAGDDAMIGVSPVGHGGRCTTISFSSARPGAFRVTVTDAGEYRIRTVGSGVGRSNHAITVKPSGAGRVGEFAISLD